ncbi:hypothetical protein [Paraburkholderia caribensis]|uniref:hypothetical protein n=1 Tax=Paraburkholderia caribensis TaxID=75105 RepID=UPI0011B248B5|nr:hypothetical protein [Paraburkholderia caribensis]
MAALMMSGLRACVHEFFRNLDGGRHTGSRDQRIGASKALRNLGAELFDLARIRLIEHAQPSAH